MRVTSLFWLLAIPILVALAMFFAGPLDAPPAGMTSSDQLAVYMTVLAAGLTITAALRLLARGGAGVGRRVVVWLAIFLVGGFAFDSRYELRVLYDLARGNIHPSVALTTAQGEAQLRRGWDGHYRAEAEVNGVKTMMLVDTGASMVLLPYEIARQIGINPDTLKFTLPVTTANGPSAVAPVRISSIRIGPVAVFDVEGAIAQPGRLKSGLLGLTFLEQLSETSFRGNRLFLKN